MIVTEVQFDPTLVLGPADELQPRSPGLHLSAIYADLELSLGLKDRRNEFTEADLNWYRSVGFLWEWTLARAMSRSLEWGCGWERPGEFTRDGIIGSPDLIDPSGPDGLVVVDSKATYRSANKLGNLEKFFWPWVVQLRSYCHMVSADRARLLVLFINGNYAPPRPVIKQLDLHFSERELLDNWNMILQHARLRGWLPAAVPAATSSRNNGDK